jgi:colanic acid biosynthesis glycosyl transferase WcaI
MKQWLPRRGYDEIALRFGGIDGAGMPDEKDSGATGNGGPRQDTTQHLRVLLVNQYYAPSDAPTAKLLADVGTALVRRGHDVTAISSNRGYKDSSVRYSRRDLIGGVDVRRVPGTGFSQKRRRGRVANYLGFFAPSIVRLLTIRKPDVLVCLSSPPLLGSIVQMIASMRGIRIVYWMMDVHPELAFKLGHIKSDSLIGRTLDAAARIPLRQADVVIALGEDMARRIRPHSNGNTTVIHNWADGVRIRPADLADHPLREERGWNEKFVIVYSGNMGLVHEFDTILEAATELDGDRRYLFCFVGGGPRCADIKSEVKKRKLHNVEFRNYVPDEQLPQNLTAANVHLVSLRDDLAGLSVPSKTYSILAAGRPIAFVGPQESDIAEILKTNDCGVHIQNGDAKGLVGAIRAYSESSRLESVHAVAARTVFDSEYSAERGMDSMVRAVTGACRSGPTEITPY